VLQRDFKSTAEGAEGVRSGQLSAFINDYATVQYFTQVSSLSDGMHFRGYTWVHTHIWAHAALLMPPAVHSNDLPATFSAAN
jgi:hypothetical protein